MDYSQLLIFHSYFRWFVLTIMCIKIIWIWFNYKINKEFTKKQFIFLLLFTLVYNIKLILGWTLYLNSTIVESFRQNLPYSIKNRQIRFFGLEHMSMMSLAIILVNINAYKSYKRINDKNAFRSLLKNYVWIYLIILSSIPWSFSPLTSRPDFR